MIKKIIYFSFSVLTIGYTSFSILIPFLEKRDLPTHFSLKTEMGTIPFFRNNINKYCSVSACGHIQNKDKKGFDFIFENQKDPMFLKSNNTYYSTKSLVLPLPIKEESLTFTYQKGKETLPVNCIGTNFCSTNMTILPFKALAQISKTTEKAKEHFILLTDKNQNITLLKNKKNNIYQPVTPLTQNKIDKTRFLLLLSSYKRPVYLTDLIARLNNFNYNKNDFDIAVSVKGVSSDVVDNLLLSDFEEDIKTGHLIFKTDENKNQFTNLLNTYRDIDLSNYDYLLKIDDDDWYHKDYLKTLHLILTTLNHPDFIVSNNLTYLRMNASFSFLKQGQASNMGSSICMKTNFATELLKIEKMEDTAIEKLIPSDSNLKAPFKIAYEDRFINALAHQAEKKYIYFTNVPLFIYNKQNASITRLK